MQGKNVTKKTRTHRRGMQEDDGGIRAPCPITVPAPPVEDGRQAPENPNRISPKRKDIPASPHAPGTPGSGRTDPDYAP